MGRLSARITGRRAKVLGAALAALIGLWLLLSFLAAYKLTRRPRPPFREPIPIAAWGKFEAVSLETHDGQRIGAWFVEGPEDGPTVLLLHGNGGSRASSLGLAEFLVAERCSVLAISLRAHGDSTGDTNDFGWSARSDVIAAVAFLEKRRPGRPIVIEGTSLGAASAIFAAGELRDRVRGYVLEAPYRDIHTAVRNRTRAYLPMPISFVAYFGLRSMAQIVLPQAEEIAPVDRIADIPETVPILLMAGGHDDRARPEEVEEMQARVASHSRHIVFDGAKHESFLMHDPHRYRAEVVEFLRRIAALARHTPTQN